MEAAVERPGVLAPAVEDEALLSVVARLRNEGVRVVQSLDGESSPSGCDRQLVRKGSEWVLEAL